MDQNKIEKLILKILRKNTSNSDLEDYEKVWIAQEITKEIANEIFLEEMPNVKIK